MKRRATLLFAVATSSTAMADPKPTPAPTPPRMLATGAPACGNVYYKAPPTCTAVRVILTAVSEDLEKIRGVFAVFEWTDLVSKSLPLTLAEAPRPRS